MTAATAKSGALTTESLAPFKFLTGSGSCANGTCTFGGSTSAGLPVGVTVGHGTAPPPRGTPSTTVQPWIQAGSPGGITGGGVQVTHTCGGP